MKELEIVKDQLELALTEIKGIASEETELLHDYVFEAHRIVKNLIMYGVSNSEADCKYKDSCGLFPCNLTECDEYEPEESEASVCTLLIGSCSDIGREENDCNVCDYLVQTDC